MEKENKVYVLLKEDENGFSCFETLFFSKDQVKNYVREKYPNDDIRINFNSGDISKKRGPHFDPIFLIVEYEIP